VAVIEKMLLAYFSAAALSILYDSVNLGHAFWLPCQLSSTTRKIWAGL